MSEWKKVGSVRKSKEGKTYIKIDADVTLKKGSMLQVQDPRRKLDEAVAAGRMTAERAEEIKAKIPDYIKQELVLPPPR